MRPVSQKEIKYLKKWRSGNKWKIIITEGLIWGVFTSVLSYFFKIRFMISLLEWTSLISSIVIFCIGGLIMGYFRYHAQKKRYHKVLQHYPNLLLSNSD